MRDHGVRFPDEILLCVLIGDVTPWGMKILSATLWGETPFSDAGLFVCLVFFVFVVVVRSDCEAAGPVECCSV